jgi:hypothetical protein
VNRRAGTDLKSLDRREACREFANAFAPAEHRLAIRSSDGRARLKKATPP